MQNKVYRNLGNLYETSPSFPINKKDKLVIMSDMHMGRGDGKDDFTANSPLFLSALKHYYFEKDYTLVLNGDIEELQRFKFNQIFKQWKRVYHLFDKFAANNRLLKTVGNHDIALLTKEYEEYPYYIHESLSLNYKNDNDIFIFHGHQASKKYTLQNALIGYTLRYIANPLGIMNYSVAHSSRKKYKIEKTAYNFSRQQKVMSIIGHTHRPLFESLPKPERIRFRIEQLIREYSNKELRENERLVKLIKNYKDELRLIHRQSREYHNLYNEILYVPCLFNAGCVIGKRGITCLEITNGKIRLVHWFDKKISKKYLHHTGYEPQQLGKSDFFRLLINKEKLNYIFTRINVLAE